MTKKNRILQIDFFRGLAIILMITYHILVDLNMFFGKEIYYNSYPLKFIGRTSAIMFIFISGVCANLSENNYKNGLKVFSFGMILTFITYITFPKQFILFGILHLIGLGMLISNFVRKLNTTIIFILGICIIFVGNTFKTFALNTSFFIPIGITTNQFISMDYYPIFPWIGVFLIGISLSQITIRIINNMNIVFFLKPICYVGKHSLVIYLFHQPIAIASLFLLFKFL